MLISDQADNILLQRADECGARGLIGIPSHEVGFLLAQVLSGLGFAACLCPSVELGLVTDVEGPGNVTDCEG